MANPQERSVNVPPPPPRQQDSERSSQPIFDYISFCDREQSSKAIDDYICFYDGNIPDSENCSQDIPDYISVRSEKILSECREKLEAAVKAMNHLSFCGWEFFHAQDKNKTEVLYKAPSRRLFFSLLAACKGFAEANGDHLPKEDSESDNTVQDESPKQFLQPQDNVQVLGKVSRMGKPVYESRSSIKDSYYQSRMVVNAQVVEDSDQSRMLLKDSDRPRKLRKLGSQEAASSSSTRSTILSCLIDSNVVLPGEMVQYRKGGRALKNGMITREGILCSCCQQVYGLSSFEAHAENHRPSELIFLKDGWSLLDCEIEPKGDVKVHETKARNKWNDDICSVCYEHDYGEGDDDDELLLCDECPSAFHASCLGLEEHPPGDWFCPSCCCGICHTKQFDRNKNVLWCYQCKHQYHVRCVSSYNLLKLVDSSYREGEWFCNDKCEQIFLGLGRILGKQVPLGFNGLSWTLLKATKQDGSSHSTENHSKLSGALDVMHKSFKPLEGKGSQSSGDLMKDIIFSQWSELSRLNFQEFYTAILERNDEIVTVATLRVHGEKVAEIPFIATLFKHQKQGMCRALMNQLEKKLAELGVKRLVLPATTDAVNFWISSFGFSKMTKDQRLGFLDITFLTFDGTVMCQKLL